MHNPATMLINTLLLAMALALFSVAAKATPLATPAGFTCEDPVSQNRFEARKSVQYQLKQAEPGSI